MPKIPGRELKTVAGRAFRSALTWEERLSGIERAVREYRKKCRVQFARVMKFSGGFREHGREGRCVCRQWGGKLLTVYRAEVGYVWNVIGREERQHSEPFASQDDAITDLALTLGVFSLDGIFLDVKRADVDRLAAEADGGDEKCMRVVRLLARAVDVAEDDIRKAPTWRHVASLALAECEYREED